jgi:hypothetical protein
MIKFKQKLYFAPAAALAAVGGKAGLAVMGAGTGISAIQGYNANSEAEEQTEEMKRHNMKMEKIAKEQVQEQKNFGAAQIMSMVKNATEAVKNSQVGGFANDMYKMHGSGLKKAAGIGASFAGLGYIGNRAAQSWKDHDEGNDGKTGKALAKIAGTAAVVGGGVLAAKKGVLGKTAQNFMSKEGTGGKALSSLGKAVNPIVRDDKTGAIKGKATLGKVAMNGFFAGMPVLGYAAQRGQEKEQSEAQANYSEKEGSGIGKKILSGLAVAGTVAGGVYGARKGVFGAGAQKAVGNKLAQAGSFLGKYGATKGVGERLIKSGSDAFGQGSAKKLADLQANAFGKGTGVQMSAEQIQKKAQEIAARRSKMAMETPASLKKGASETIGGAMNWFGMMGTKSGTGAVQNTANRLASSKNEISKSVGEWMQKNPNAANIGAGAAAMAGGLGAMSVGEKAVKAVTKTVDKGAYDIEKEQNQKVYSMVTFKEKGTRVDKKTGLRTKFTRKKTKVDEPGFHSESVAVSEKSFTKYDQTDQLKGMTDADILAEQKRPTSSMNLGKSAVGAGAGAIAGGLIGKKLGAGGTGAAIGAAAGGLAGMDGQTREKTGIGTALGSVAGGLLSMKAGRGFKSGALVGGALGGTAGMMTGIASGHKQNSENQFFNDRLEYAQSKAKKRERADWKNNMNNREGYTR